MFLVCRQAICLRNRHDDMTLSLWDESAAAGAADAAATLCDTDYRSAYRRASNFVIYILRRRLLHAFYVLRCPLKTATHEDQESGPRRTGMRYDN